MRSLTSLVRHAAPDDALADAMRAILDSGLIVSVRDSAGRFVQTSPVFGDLLGMAQDARGRDRIEGATFYDVHGRQLAMREHPSYVARMTGKPQRNCLVGYRTREGREIWLLMSFIPIAPGPGGWSVLGVGTDVTPLRGSIASLEGRAAAAEALQAAALRYAGDGLSDADLTDALGPAMAAAVPHANVVAVFREGQQFRVAPVYRAFGEPLEPRPVRVTPEAATRWESGETHVNLDVRQSDIYGDRVIAEWRWPARSVVVAPAFDASGARVGALVATAQAPDAFTPDQVRTLESAATLLGRLARPDSATRDLRLSA